MNYLRSFNNYNNIIIRRSDPLDYEKTFYNHPLPVPFYLAKLQS